MSDFATGETPREHSPRLLQRVYKVIQRLQSSQRTGQVYANRFFTLERTVGNFRFWPRSACRPEGSGTSLLAVCVQQRLARSRRAQSKAGTDLKQVCPETVRTWPERERSGRAPGAIGRLG